MLRDIGIIWLSWLRMVITLYPLLGNSPNYNSSVLTWSFVLLFIIVIILSTGILLGRIDTAMLAVVVARVRHIGIDLGDGIHDSINHLPVSKRITLLVVLYKVSCVYVVLYQNSGPCIVYGVRIILTLNSQSTSWPFHIS